MQFNLYIIFVNKRLKLKFLFKKKKENKKLSDITCTDNFECDSARGLTCQGPAGLKACAYFFFKL